MRRPIIVACLTLGLVVAEGKPNGVAAQVAAITVVSPADQSSLRAWDGTLRALVAGDTLRLREQHIETVLPGHLFEQLDQYVNGVPVWGAGVAQELVHSELVAAFGVLFNGSIANAEPRLSVEDAADRIGLLAGTSFGPNPSKQPRLFFYPVDGNLRLAWIGTLANDTGLLTYVIDAIDGTEITRWDARRTQLPTGSSVGHGKGILGDDKKISTAAVSGGFVAYDTIRPPEILTFDLRGNLVKAILMANGYLEPSLSDLAFVGSSNEWSDAAVVDAHAYSSLTYDYYYKRFGRRGLDNRNHPMWNVVHQARRQDYGAVQDDSYWFNASWDGEKMSYGEGCGCITNYFGFGPQTVDYFSGAIDVVGHELTHGVTQMSSGLIYQNESGALDESFSDIMGTSIEFFYQPPGSGAMRADYLIGEDTLRAATASALSGLRSLENPQLYGQPDHYSRRRLGASDHGYVHANSGISNNAFYLAVEGGVNRTSGIRVQGVGGNNREQIEKVFYVAFTSLLPRSATFSMARAATLRTAQDLYGLSSAPYAAIRDAWTAVGVN